MFYIYKNIQTGSCHTGFFLIKKYIQLELIVAVGLPPARPHVLLLVELFTHWAGPCAPLRPALERLAAASAGPVPLRLIAADVDGILGSLPARPSLSLPTP